MIEYCPLGMRTDILTSHMSPINRRDEKGFFDEERRLDKSRGCFEIMKGKVESDEVTSAQSKGAESIIMVIRGSEIRTGNESVMDMVGNGGSVCVDIDAVDEGMIT